MRTVLVVEDYQELAETFATVLNGTGRYEVLSACTGMEAVPLLEAGNVDLALIDALLPGEISGIELCRRALALAVPSIMMSGDHRLSDDLRAHGVPQLRKPFRITALIEMIDVELARYSHNLILVREGLERLRANVRDLAEIRRNLKS